MNSSQQQQKEPRRMPWQPAWEQREANAHTPPQQALQGSHQQSTPFPPGAVRSVSEQVTSATTARPPNAHAPQRYRNMDGTNNNSGLSSKGKNEEDAIEINDSDDDEEEGKEISTAAKISTSNTDRESSLPGNHYANNGNNHGTTNGNNNNNCTQTSQSVTTSAAAKPSKPVKTHNARRAYAQPHTAFQLYVIEADPDTPLMVLEFAWKGQMPAVKAVYEEKARKLKELYDKNERRREQDRNFQKKVASGEQTGAVPNVQSNRGKNRKILGSSAHRTTLAAQNHNNDGNSIRRNASSTSPAHFNQSAGTPPNNSKNSNRGSLNNTMSRMAPNKDVVEIDGDDDDDGQPLRGRIGILNAHACPAVRPVTRTHDGDDDDDSEVEYVESFKNAPADHGTTRHDASHKSRNALASSLHTMPGGAQSELTMHSSDRLEGHRREGQPFAQSTSQHRAVGKEATQTFAREKPDPPSGGRIKTTRRKQHSTNEYLDDVEVIRVMVNLCDDSDDDGAGSNRNREMLARAKNRRPTNPLTSSRKSIKQNGTKTVAANSRPATPHGEYDPSRGRAGRIVNGGSPDPDGRTLFDSEDIEKVNSMKRRQRRKRKMLHCQHEQIPRFPQTVHHEQPSRSNSGAAGKEHSAHRVARATHPSGSGHDSNAEKEAMAKADRLLAKKRKFPSRPEMKTWTAKIKARMDEPCEYDAADFDSMVLAQPELWESLATRGMDGDTSSVTSLNSSQVSSTDTSFSSGEESDGDKKPRARKTPRRRVDRNTRRGSNGRTQFESDFDSDVDSSDDSGCSEEVLANEKEDSDLEKYKEIIHIFEHRQGNTIEEIEKSKVVRSDKKLNSNKQYGKITEKGMKIINRVVFDRELRPGKSFLDIGHGIGNLCLQVAYMFGCRAKGIEIDEGRNSVATRLKDHFESIYSQQKEIDQKQVTPGPVEFIHGGLEEPAHRPFLVEDTDFTIVNNFGGVFSGERGSGVCLDRVIGGLFGLMKPGAVLVTLHPLNGALGCCKLSTQNEKRKNANLEESANASFYELSIYELGAMRDFVDWAGAGNTNTFKVYKYTRTQSAQAVFLCNRKGCQGSATPMEAVQFDKDGAPYITSCCTHCGLGEKICRNRDNEVDYTGEKITTSLK